MTIVTYHRIKVPVGDLSCKLIWWILSRGWRTSLPRYKARKINSLPSSKKRRNSSRLSWSSRSKPLRWNYRSNRVSLHLVSTRQFNQNLLLKKVPKILTRISFQASRSEKTCRKTLSTIRNKSARPQCCKNKPTRAAEIILVHLKIWVGFSLPRFQLEAPLRRQNPMSRKWSTESPRTPKSTSRIRRSYNRSWPKKIPKITPDLAWMIIQINLNILHLTIQSLKIRKISC